MRKAKWQSLTLVLEPIPTTGMTSADVPELMDRTYNAMLECLREISKPVDKTAKPASPTPLLSGTEPTSYSTMKTTDKRASVNTTDTDAMTVGASDAGTEVASLAKTDTKDSGSGKKLTIA